MSKPNYAFEFNDPESDDYSSLSYDETKDFLTVKVADNPSDRRDVYLNFSSRLAVMEFAKHLIWNAIYKENGMVEILPRDFAVGHVKLTGDSSRLFIFFDENSPDPE